MLLSDLTFNPGLIIWFIKGVFPDVENGLLKRVQRNLQMLLLVDPTVEQRGGNAGGLLVPGVLIGPPGAADHTRWAGERRDGPVPIFSNCSLPPRPPSSTHRQIKPCAHWTWEKVFQDKYFFPGKLYVKPRLPLVTATTDNSWICQILQRWALSAPQPVSSQVGWDFFRSHIRIQAAAFMSPLGSVACDTGHPNNFRFVQRLQWLMTALRLWQGIKPLQDNSSKMSGSDFWLCDAALMLLIKI